MILEVFLVLIGILALINFYIRFNRTGRMIDRLPGPTAYPFIGNIYNLKGDGESIFLKLRNLNTQYYPIYRLWVLHVAAVNIMHPDDIEVILSSAKHIEKGPVYAYLHPWLSTGLLTSAGSKWYRRRKILTPAFHFNILSHFVNTFIEQSEHLVKTLKNEAKGGSIVKNLTELISEHALNAICETAMGINIREKTSFQTEYLNAVRVVGKFIPYRLVRPWYYPDFIFDLTSNGRTQTRLLKVLHGFTESIIEERKRYHENTNKAYLKNFDQTDKETMSDDKDSDGDFNMHKRRLAMLDLLLYASLKDNQIDDKGIREEVDTFTFEGHDTTSMALCFALLLLAKHKDAQERIREEVNEVMLEKKGKLTIGEIQNFSYLDRCLKESLRLYPSVPFISRLIKEDCLLRNYRIPGGVTCHIHIYEVHRDPAFWPNPLVFDPDRFLPENVKTRHPFSYIPFSAGLRNCIGQKFAILEMKLAIAFLLHNFILEPVEELDDVRIVADLVLRPVQTLPLKFIPFR